MRGLRSGGGSIYIATAQDQVLGALHRYLGVAKPVSSCLLAHQRNSEVNGCMIITVCSPTPPGPKHCLILVMAIT